MNSNDALTSLNIDAATLHLLVRVAKAWGVSEREAIRRALEQANASSDTQSSADRLDIFKELQQRLSLTPAKAAEWQEAVRETRR
ncbi:MAG TPA: hypothetical protein VKB46_01035 [Pyrinomonadaceae bacterium]|nr:hypothetical protein [Pyrinomonadaceae bacterium]